MKVYPIKLWFSLLILLPWTSVLGQDTTTIFQATLQETDAPTPNISTEELQQLLTEASALVLDSRSFPEWATGHIPGAIVLAAKPGQAASEYVSDIAEVERLTNGDKDAAIVLYCNGPFCGKSKRLSGELKEAGYTNVRRYQLGAPVWRALGHPMVIEPAGIQYVLGDNTAYWVDARDPAEVQVMGGLTGVAHLTNVPSGTVTQAKDEKRLPMHDYNTRIVVFGAHGEQAQQLAQELTQGAFHNVAYFQGSYDEFLAAVAGAASDVGVVRRAHEAFAQGDVPTFLSLLDAKVEWVEPEGVPWAGTYVGPDAVLNDVLIPLTSAWDGFTVTPETFMDAGDNITVLGTISGTNKATGKRLETPYIAVWTLGDSKVVKYQSFVNTLAFIEATTSGQSD
jgi:rhodanese-related sulfurtransferase/ketosteroid isomerase-like protein